MLLKLYPMLGFYLVLFYPVLVTMVGFSRYYGFLSGMLSLAICGLVLINLTNNMINGPLYSLYHGLW